VTTALEAAIRSQPNELERLLHLDIEAAVQRLHGGQRLWFVGTGSSQHVAELASVMFREAGFGTHASPAMRFASFTPPLSSGDAVIVITHTGDTAYARAAYELASRSGHTVLAVTGHGAGLPHALETVARERSETYTVSYTAALLVLARIAGRFGAPSCDAAALARVPQAVRAALDAVDDLVTPERLLVYAGAGVAATTAREGALKAREAARVPAEGYDVEYLLHGSAVPLRETDHVALLAPPCDPDGFVAAIGRAAEGAGVPLTIIEEPDGLPPLVAQIPLTVRLQRIALRMAEERGQDPDTVITGAWDDRVLWRLGRPPS
jgi:glucosamine--fructose-6-phosphate aminotransferase (isomerizing)